MVNALITRDTQINHADISQHVIAVNRAFENPAIAHFWNPATSAGRAALDGVITQQAQIIAYLDDHKVLTSSRCSPRYRYSFLFKGSSSAGAGGAVAMD